MPNMEQPQVNNLPEEIKVEGMELEAEKDNKKEPPQEIDPDLPPSPPEKNFVL